MLDQDIAEVPGASWGSPLGQLRSGHVCTVDSSVSKSDGP